MPNVTDNISFDTVAREWRCKWSEDNEKASLVALQELLNAHTATIKSIEGVNIQRVVCGECKDFKVVISTPVDVYGKWAEGGHAPEADFTAQMGAIAGVTCVET